jgi:uncharacterized membrane protein
MSVQWNKVTWYSKLFAVIIYIITLGVGVYIGIQYETLKMIK